MSERGWLIFQEARAVNRSELAARARRKVLHVLGLAIAPASVLQIAQAASLSTHQVRRALETLCAMHAIEASGQKNNRRYGLAKAKGAAA